MTNHTALLPIEQIDMEAAARYLEYEDTTDLLKLAEIQLLAGHFAAHRLQAPAEAGALLPMELREQIEKLATKQDGYGMSFHAKGLGGRGPATLNVYGDRALAAMWIINHGLAALQAPAEAGEAALPQWRCVNCKAAVSSSGEPDRCLTCEWCTEFAAVTPSGEAGELQRLREAAQHMVDAWAASNQDHIECAEANLRAALVGQPLRYQTWAEDRAALASGAGDDLGASGGKG